jgi:hypothetical protein
MLKRLARAIKKRRFERHWAQIMQKLSDGGTVRMERPKPVRFPGRW